MIEFHNGHRFDFGCASGALGFHGDGWWFEQPWRWLGILRPEDFTIITKTLTFTARKGNLVWHAPWRAVRLYKGSVANAISLTNPGYMWWLGEPYRYIVGRGYKVVVSIAPGTPHEAATMAGAFSGAKIVGLQLNVSCPNVGHTDCVYGIIDVTIKATGHPLIVKLAYQDDYLSICKEFDGRVSAYELINAVPFPMVYPRGGSPLSRYGYTGAVSGKAIAGMALEALVNAKENGIRTPIISGGGIDSLEEVRIREAAGAAGFVFGSVFIRKPWLPNRIVTQYRDGKAA